MDYFDSKFSENFLGGQMPTVQTNPSTHLRHPDHRTFGTRLRDPPKFWDKSPPLLTDVYNNSSVLISIPQIFSPWASVVLCVFTRKLHNNAAFIAEAASVHCSQCRLKNPGPVDNHRAGLRIVNNALYGGQRTLIVAWVTLSLYSTSQHNKKC